MANVHTSSTGRSFRSYWLCSIPYLYCSPGGFSGKVVSGGLVILVFIAIQKNRNHRKDLSSDGEYSCAYYHLDHHQRIDKPAAEHKADANRQRIIFHLSFWATIGQASVKTVYAYLGYYNVCHLGGEIKNPERIFQEVFLFQLVA